MPTFDFTCPACKQERPNQLVRASEFVVCECGATMKKLVAMPAVLWGAGVHPKHEGSRALAAKNMEHPNVVAGLKSGRYAIEAAKDSQDGLGTSSCITTRLEEGTL